MSLKDLKIADTANEGVEMQIKSPSGELMDGFIRVLGADSAEYQRRLRAWIERTRNRPANQSSFADDEKTAIENRVACVVGWRGKEFDDWMEYSPENARKLLTDPNYRWLFEQIGEFMSDRANFIPSNDEN